MDSKLTKFLWPLEFEIWIHESTNLCGSLSWGYGLKTHQCFEGNELGRSIQAPTTLSLVRDDVQKERPTLRDLRGLHVDMVNTAHVLLPQSKTTIAAGVHWVVLLCWVLDGAVVPSSCFTLESYDHFGCLDTLQNLLPEAIVWLSGIQFDAW